MIKKNWKMIIIIVISIIVSSAVGVFAAGSLTASQVYYDKGSGVTVELDDVLDDLYSKVPLSVGDLVTYDGNGTDEQFYVLHVGKETCEIITRYNLTNTASPSTQTKAYYETTACAFSSTKYWGSTTRIKL